MLYFYGKRPEGDRGEVPLEAWKQEAHLETFVALFIRGASRE